MMTFSLQSGSNGNSIYVEAGDVRLLFDAGITGASAQRRMAIHDRDIRDVTALIISHDHADHCRYAGVFHRKFGIPLYITPQTQRAAWYDLGQLTDVRHFCSGDILEFGAVRVHTIRTPHDAVDGVAFIVEFEGKRLGVLTDLGHPFNGLQSILESLDGAYLESNYDPELLEMSDYPAVLRERIRGLGGHLSNDEAATLMHNCSRSRPRWVAVAHLSQDNNRPDLAISAMQQAVGRHYPVHHASRYEASPLFEL